MPARSRLQLGLQRLFRKRPSLSTAALRLLDLWYEVALLPFRRVRVRGTPTENAQLTARTEAYNQAAERYFREFSTPSFLLDKPFSEPMALPKHLIDAGVLISGLRAAPGDVVLEFGAGSCWLSHMLNRYGCATRAVDVSSTVLELGRRLFEADPRTKWDLAPQFLVYDGHRLPVDDASCDRIVINDAFHHVPNQRELLTEMCRVLRPDGIVAMSEPGHGHAASEHSLNEASHWGVLENELVLEDVAALARDCGFREVKAIVASPRVYQEIDTRDLGAFMGGKGFASYWKAFCGALESHHYILCFKGEAAPTTKWPARVSARLELAAPAPASCRVGEPLVVTLRIANAGDTIWLGGSTPRSGWTRLGAHLSRGDSMRTSIDVDWWRGPLPVDVAPGGSVTVDVVLPIIIEPGHYVAGFDLVIEGMAWFAELGSPPLNVNVLVI